MRPNARKHGVSSSVDEAGTVQWARGLSLRQKRFVEEFLVLANATKAAMAAGYSGKGAAVQGHRLLRNVKVAAALKQAMEARNRRMEVSADIVVGELAEIGFSRITDFVHWDERGRLEIKGSDGIDPGRMAAVRKLVRRVTSSGEHTFLELHDKISALIRLGRHVGLFDNFRHSNRPPNKIPGMKDTPPRPKVPLVLLQELLARGRQAVEPVDRPAVAGNSKRDPIRSR